MNWEAIGAIGDFVGGLAVIAGLFFVGMQLMMANRESRIAANQRYAESITEMGKLITDSTEVAGIYRRGMTDVDSLDPDERVRFYALLGTNILRTWENLYLQNEEKRLDEHLWYGAERMLRTLVAGKGFQDVWETRRQWYTPAFQSFIDKLVSAGSENSFEQTYRLSTNDASDT